MNNKGNCLMSLLALLFGAAFIWLHDHVNLIDTLINLVGLAFVVPAIISILSLFMSKKVQQTSALARGIQAICTVGGLGLGIVILVMPSTFRPWLVYLFAALMIIGGATQVFQIAQRMHRGDYPTWMYFPPIAVLVTGVITMVLPAMHNPENEQIMVLVSGIAFVVYGVTGLLVSILRKKPKPATEAVVESHPSHAEASHQPEASTTTDNHSEPATGSDSADSEISDNK